MQLHSPLLLYSARYQLDTIIASESFGGETAIGGLIENYPGTPDIDGFDLMLKFKEQVDKLEVPTISRNLEAVEPSDDVIVSSALWAAAISWTPVP